jgi:riboflavin kinase/FMN adenylyltransferase
MRTKLVRSLAEGPFGKPSSLSIGVFDGVHLGHRYLVGRVMESAQVSGHLSGVVTFDRHPDELLAPHRDVLYLTTPTEKLQLLSELGLDFVVALPFTSELAETTARDFVLALLKHLQMRELWIGPDFALGRGREGNGDYLELLGKELGFQVHRPRPFSESGSVVSSSGIRALVNEGRIAEATQLLGRYPAISGTVVRGSRRGHELGFPTANLAMDDRLIIPPDGVYVARVLWEDANHAGVVNVGRRPTFEQDGQTIVEAHILDFTGDLYGKNVRVELVERLRPEQRFESVSALIAQMETDVANTRLVLKKAGLG